MADSIEDGGPAFPELDYEYEGGDNRRVYFSAGGMSLRDYAAIHSERPELGAICALLGLRLAHGSVWKDEATQIATAETWWNSKPFEEQCLLLARVRYAQADAMLIARKKP